MSVRQEDSSVSVAAMTNLSSASESDAHIDSESRHLSAPRITALIILALIPFWAIPIAHIMSNPGTATGFFHYELPYYVANGRAAFERGNGVLYPNPYDPAADAPAIYAHWLPWTFGLLTAGLGLDPGDVILTFTFFASLALALTTLRLVRERTPRDKDLSVAFLIAMLGGGILCAAGLLLGSAADPAAASATLDRMLSFDPGHGMWFLNWGRNALFPTEAIYHSLVALCWLAEIRRKPRWANLWMILLATTHPWSGIELLLTINLWRGICFLRDKDAASRNQLSVSIGVLAAFLLYYKVWLPRFPSHAQLQSVWELNWRLSSVSAAFAYLPVLIPCLIQIRRKWAGKTWQRSEQFLLCAVVVATGLTFHDRLIKPVQPLHFTRGYVWMPILLLGLPVILEWWDGVRPRSTAGAIAAVCCVVLLMSDNLIFSVLHCHRQWTGQDGFHLDGDERALLLRLNSDDFAGRVVITESESVNYLLPTYAKVRPWLGHQFNTPNFADRKATWSHSLRDDSVDLTWVSTEVDTILIRDSRGDIELQDSPEWQPRSMQNAVWRGWNRDRSVVPADLRQFNGRRSQTAGFGQNFQ